MARRLEAVGKVSAAERVKQCSVPKEGGWRPGARWARQGRDEQQKQGPTDPGLPSQREREHVEAAIAGLPTHQQPPSRELGRTSETAPHPFAEAPREMARRCEAATHPFKPETVDWQGKSLQRAIDDLPPHQRPSAKSLLRAHAVTSDPFATSPGRRRPTSRDGHNGEAGFLDPPGATRLARLADLPPVRHHGEGPRPSGKGGQVVDETGLEPGRFFQTGRHLASLVARSHALAADTVVVPPVATPGQPLATIEKTGARVELVAVCPVARTRGLRPGMALTTARAQLPELETQAADRAGDARDLAQLADILARRWSPNVEISDADGLLIDLTGVAHLRGGEMLWCRRLLRMLALRGFTGRMAVADTAGAAWALARYGEQALTIVSPGEQAKALESLPPAALRLEPASLDLLHRLGVDRIGQLLAMPRAPLARRFTRTIVDRLDQALGHAPQALDPVVPRDAVTVARRFLEPIATAEAIEQVLRDMTPELVERLAQDGRGARSLELVADRVDGVPQRLRIGFARPTREGPHMLRLMLRRIEEIEPGYGIDVMTLHVRRSDRLGAEPLGPELVEKTPPDLASLVDAIVNRIGPQRLWRMQTVESEVPERAVKRVAPLAEARRGGPALARDDVRHLDATPPNHPWHPRWPRPVRLLRRPERVQHVVSELPDYPPRRFTWRGRTYKVAAAEGPERIAGEWWRRTSERWSLRDYYLVETESGERFWLFRRGDGVRAETGDLTWYLHGR